MDVMAIAKRMDRQDPERDWYEVDPDVMYPATLNYIAAVRTGEETATSIDVRREMETLHGLPDDTTRIARQRLEMAAGRARERFIVLEVARKVFTAMLHAKNGRPIGIRILRKDHWRLT